MTLAEAADFLRLSKSTLYQRKDIPRYRIPGSRALRYLRNDLIAWLKGTFRSQQETVTANDLQTLETLAATRKPVYHRSNRYR